MAESCWPSIFSIYNKRCNALLMRGGMDSGLERNRDKKINCLLHTARAISTGSVAWWCTATPAPWWNWWLTQGCRRGWSLGKLCWRPLRVQCSSFQGPKSYKAWCGHICLSIIRLSVVVFAQAHYWVRLKKNEHALGLVTRLTENNLFPFFGQPPSLRSLWQLPH